jgi:hypothetical protein
MDKFRRVSSAPHLLTPHRPSNPMHIIRSIEQMRQHNHRLNRPHNPADSVPHEHELKHDPRDPCGHFSKEFDLIDLDHDEYLCHEELRKGLLVQLWSQQEVDELFNLIDLNKDRKISKDEYISFRGALLFESFAVRTAHTADLLLVEDYTPLDPKSRELIKRSATSLYNVEDEPASPSSVNSNKVPIPALHVLMPEKHSKNFFIPAARAEAYPPRPPRAGAGPYSANQDRRPRWDARGWQEPPQGRRGGGGAHLARPARPWPCRSSLGRSRP